MLDVVVMHVDNRPLISASATQHSHSKCLWARKCCFLPRKRLKTCKVAHLSLIAAYNAFISVTYFLAITLLEDKSTVSNVLGTRCCLACVLYAALVRCLVDAALQLGVFGLAIPPHVPTCKGWLNCKTPDRCPASCRQQARSLRISRLNVGLLQAGPGDSDTPSSALSAADARKILGVSENASFEQTVKAKNRMLQEAGQNSEKQMQARFMHSFGRRLLPHVIITTLVDSKATRFPCISLGYITSCKSVLVGQECLLFCLWCSSGLHR